MKFRSTAKQSSDGGRADGFGYLPPTEVYLDAACQSLRPQPVIDALAEYYREYGACGGRVKYAWGARVDAEVLAVRERLVRLVRAGSGSVAAFTLNTSYALNLVLQQLPHGVYDRIVTSDIEHNSVFLSSMTAATRLGIPRVVVPRDQDGSFPTGGAELERAVVVVNAASNIDGRLLLNLADLVHEVHRRGGIVVVDAAQAMAHSAAIVAGSGADAVCFSAHKMYGASLGVLVATKSLLESLELSFVGGGMVAGVSESGFDLLPDEPWARVEPGLQAWGEIIALGAALDWKESVRPGGLTPEAHMQMLQDRLYSGLRGIQGLSVLNDGPAPVISVYSRTVDAHRLAVFLSKAGIMARSGYFCAHYYLKDRCGLPPLLRFSLGLHNTADDVDTAISRLSALATGLR